MNSVNPDPNLAKTHGSLFATFFPIAKVPPNIRELIQARAEKLSAAMLAGFEASSFAGVLKVMTYPKTLLPAQVVSYLQNLGDPAVNLFLESGYSALDGDRRLDLFDRFVEGEQPLPKIAGAIRMVYLSSIWDLPLAGPIIGIQDQQIFIDNIDVYVAQHTPQIPPSVLRYDPVSQTITCFDGRPIDYLVIGSGPGGATVAHQLQQSGARVVLMEKGPFVVWGSMTTRSYPTLMYLDDQATTADGSILVRSGETVGGGSTVNIDLAFSPLEATVQARVQGWIDKGIIDEAHYGLEALARIYDWVTATIRTRELSESELNQDNLVLWNGAKAFGVDPSLYHLNRYFVGSSPSPVDDKRDASLQLLLAAIQESKNPLSIIADADATEILFEDGTHASGVRFTAQQPWSQYGNTVVDPYKLSIPAGASVSIQARNVIVSAGTIGSTRLLLSTASANPAVLDASPESMIGKGLVMHPSVPIIGVFDRPIDLLQGLDSATHVDSFGISPGFIFETMAGLPAYGAVVIPGSPEQVYDILSEFQNSAGFGVMRVDESSLDNRILLDGQGGVTIDYSLTEVDKTALAEGVALGIRMMFLAGAQTVIIPSNENVLGLPNFRPTQAVYLTDPEQADLVKRNLKFLPNRTVLTSAHLQATNKMGTSPETSVVSTNHRVWNLQGSEIENLYVMDSSIFPTSVGANPMQSIYAFAKIFSDRLIKQTSL